MAAELCHRRRHRAQGTRRGVWPELPSYCAAEGVRWPSSMRAPLVSVHAGFA
ncbi:hypothetical protein PJI17_20110 [Mycobacterium kansasii]